MLSFVEVKTRATRAVGPPELSVTPAKRRRIARAAQAYLTMKNVAEQECRFDVVSVSPSADGSDWDVRLFKGAF